MPQDSLPRTQLADPKDPFHRTESQTRSLLAAGAGYVRALRRRPILVAAVIAYCLLVSVSIVTLRPSNDEGMFADAALSLASRGRLASTVMEETGTALSGTHRHIYYMPPLHFVLLAGCYKIFGFGLFQTRLLAAGFGLLLLAAWFAMLSALRTKSAAWSVLALALDSGFVVACSRGRMDLECAALGLSAVAAYLTLRRRSFRTAVLASSSLIVLSGLSHPNGLFYLIDTIALTLWLDRKRWSWRMVILALTPCIMGAAAWGAYIFQDPADFVRQFAANATMEGRLAFLAAPLSALYREATLRFGFVYEFRSLGHDPAILIKTLTSLIYLLPPLFWLVNREFRLAAPIGPILMVGSINFLLLSILDGQGSTFYLIHVLPSLNAALVAWFLWAQRLPRWRRIAIPIAIGWTLLQISMSVYRASRNAYRNDYMAVVNFMNSHINGNTRVVFAGQQYGFQLGFGPRLVTDMRLGFLSGRTADMIEFDGPYSGEYLEHFEKPLADHIRATMGRYCLAYDTKSAQVFLPRRSEDQASCIK
jgi:4-amino-4-deoxy-L-arabinose transferase-like glycosyltransferase